jgi:hypothetical protein
VRTELGGVSPETVVRWQKGTTRAFVVNVVEAVSKFDHRHRGY